MIVLSITYEKLIPPYSSRVRLDVLINQLYIYIYKLNVHTKLTEPSNLMEKEIVAYSLDEYLVFLKKLKCSRLKKIISH